MSLQSILRIVERNQRITRREALEVGGVLGFSFFLLNAFRPMRVRAENRASTYRNKPVPLPPPLLDGTLSVERAIKQRRTVRAFAREPLTLDQLAQILWAAQGITQDGGFMRAAPSGGALYPIDVYAVVGKDGVSNLTHGVYHYEPQHHSISRITAGDVRMAVASASLGQWWMAGAPVILVLTAEYGRITGKYGERGKRYATIEVGHIGQNIFLQSEALGLSAGIVGAFDDQKVAEVLHVKKNHEPLIIMPVGWAS